ncbi:Hypothetical protein NTJ_16200 [Nesidiocoris tenuis]|uniref:Uncharacterized protein n=1 Tax=Nesidiocoris tenuis TaxID=355587 RepID=A0ABN7BIL2_9HEMI|nr:Hypothetical protein NTJ_16200 [Nesidiocoris tenuis]
MYKFVALFAVIACASAGLVPLAAPGLIAPSVIGAPTAIVRTPSLDSAVIKSERLGGNFAYSTVEGHAYAAVSPVISHVQTPVAVSYAASPVAIRSHALVPSAPLIL